MTVLCFRLKHQTFLCFPAKRPYRRRKDTKPSAEGEGENTGVSAGKSKSNSKSGKSLAKVIGLPKERKGGCV